MSCHRAIIQTDCSLYYNFLDELGTNMQPSILAISRLHFLPAKIFETDLLMLKSQGSYSGEAAAERRRQQTGP